MKTVVGKSARHETPRVGACLSQPPSNSCMVKQPEDRAHRCQVARRLRKRDHPIFCAYVHRTIKPFCRESLDNRVEVLHGYASVTVLEFKRRKPVSTRFSGLPAAFKLFFSTKTICVSRVSDLLLKVSLAQAPTVSVRRSDAALGRIPSLLCTQAPVISC